MSNPQILIVDDQPESAEDLLKPALANNDAAFVRHPRDIVAADLSNCSVVVVDHYLENWPELESQPPAMSPRDGFALAAVLRSQVPTDVPGPAMTILTGQLPNLAGAMPIQAAEHLLAWQHDVEWVFSKSASNVAQRLQDMADAVGALRKAWRTPFDLDVLASEWLTLQDTPWRGVALDHVMQTRPPIHTVGVETNGSSVLRWFLQRVLPYPSFLTNIYWTATRLGVTTHWLTIELRKGSRLCQLLDSCAYSGAFSNFSDRRWWRAGLADAVVTLSDGRPFDLQALREGVRAFSFEDPEFLEVTRPVLALDPETMEATQVVDADAAVQIAPDGWPIYADSAWAAIGDVRNDPGLFEIVLDPSILSPESNP